MEKENTDNGTGQVMPFRKGHFTPGPPPDRFKMQALQHRLLPPSFHLYEVL